MLWAATDITDPVQQHSPNDFTKRNLFMIVLPIERYQEACDAFTTFTRDVSQLTQQTWEEAGKRQFAFLRLGQDFGEQQLRVLGNGSAISVDFWRQALSTWRELIDAFTETSDRLRASMDRIEPFWT
jgi:hypothetical protein